MNNSVQPLDAPMLVLRSCDDSRSNTFPTMKSRTTHKETKRKNSLRMPVEQNRNVSGTIPINYHLIRYPQAEKKDQCFKATYTFYFFLLIAFI